MPKSDNTTISHTGGSNAQSLSPLAQFSALFKEASIPKFLAITLQLALLLWIVDLYGIEERSGLGRELIFLIFGGFVVHAWLPLQWRMPFFFGLTVASMVIVFQPVNAAWLVGISLALIGMCHIPIAKWARLTLIIGACALLTAFRADWLTTSWSGAIITVLGSMFMFRLVLYLYDMGNEKKKATLWERICYFFMLPNVIFPFYPIVDYITYRRTYYNKDAYNIYQKGVLWMLRGTIHLLIYRVVYYYMSPAVEEIQDLGGVVVFIVSSYLLYIRISGLFHFIIGLMCLFGFNLPETHRLYYFADGFNDYWRRINIYWKDFMMKIFFYPLFMKTRSWGSTTALVFSTLVVFLCTWLLHSYQWFWLQGDFPLTAVDGIYWMVLGVLVAINSVWETKRGKKKKASKKGWDLGATARHSLQITVTLLFLSLMWSFWSSKSIEEWWYIMQVATTGTLQEYGLVLLGIFGIFASLVIHFYMEHKGWGLIWDENKLPFYNVVTRTSVMAACVLCIGLPNVNSNFGTRPSEFIASLQEGRLNDRDQSAQERGYYEGLIDGNSPNLTQVGTGTQKINKPDNWKATMNSDAVQPGEDVLVYVLKPSYDGIIKDAPFRTNQWGMRDREYTMEKDSSTFRIALLGASYEQGAGVEEPKIFPALVEDYLNENHAGNTYEKYEVLSFAVGGYSAIQAAYLTQGKVLEFEPDAIVYAIHSTEERRLLMQLQKLSLEKRDITLGYLNALYEKADVTKDIPPQEARRRLSPYTKEIIRESYLHMRDVSEREGIPVIAAFVPITEEIKQYNKEWHPVLKRFAKEANFKIVTMDGTYEGYTEADVRLTSWDTHLNETGHEVVAKGFYKALVENDAELGFGLTGDNLTDAADY